MTDVTAMLLVYAALSAFLWGLRWRRRARYWHAECAAGEAASLQQLQAARDALAAIHEEFDAAGPLFTIPQPQADPRLN